MPQPPSAPRLASYHHPAGSGLLEFLAPTTKRWGSILQVQRQSLVPPHQRSVAVAGRRHRNIYYSLSTHIMMYEDAKILRRDIYTAYSDFKGAFGGMDPRILFQLMKEYGFQDSYIAACKQL